MKITKIENVYGIKKFEGEIDIFKSEVIYASNGTCKTSLKNILKNLFENCDPQKFKDRISGDSGKINLDLDGEISSDDGDFSTKVNERTKNVYFTTINEEKVKGVFDLIKNEKYILNRKLYSVGDITDDQMKYFDEVQKIVGLLKENYSTIDEIQNTLLGLIRMILKDYDEDDIKTMSRGAFSHKKIERYSVDVDFEIIKKELDFKNNFKEKWEGNKTLSIIDIFSLSKSKIPQDIVKLEEIVKSAFNPKLLKDELYIFINNQYQKFDVFWNSINEEIDILKDELDVQDDIIEKYYKISQKITNKDFENSILDLSTESQTVEGKNKLKKLLSNNKAYANLIDPAGGEEGFLEKTFEFIKILHYKVATKGFYTSDDSQKDLIIEEIINELKDDYKKVTSELSLKIDIDTMEESSSMFNNFDINFESSKEKLLFDIEVDKLEFIYLNKKLSVDNIEYLSEGEKTYTLILLEYLMIQNSDKDEVLIVIDDTGDRLDSKNKHMFIGLISEIKGHLKEKSKNLSIKFLLHNFDYSVSLANANHFKEITRFENSDQMLNTYKYDSKDFEDGVNIYINKTSSVGVLPLLRELSKNYFYNFEFNINAKNALFHYNSEYSNKNIKDIFVDQNVIEIFDESILGKSYIELLEDKVDEIIEKDLDPNWRNDLNFIEINERKIEIALYIRVVFHKYLYDKFNQEGDKQSLSWYAHKMDDMSDELKHIYKKSVYTTNDYIHINYNFVNQLLDTSFGEMIELAKEINEEIKNGTSGN